MAVPGWPELALRGASMAKPRIRSIARASRSSMVLLAGIGTSALSTLPAVAGARRAERPIHHGSGGGLGWLRHSGCVGGSDEVLERRTVARPTMVGPPLRFGGGVLMGPSGGGRPHRTAMARSPAARAARSTAGVARRVPRRAARAATGSLPARQSRKRAIEAVKPWRWFRPPTGPSSPAQNMPGDGRACRAACSRSRRRGRASRTGGCRARCR